MLYNHRIEFIIIIIIIHQGVIETMITSLSPSFVVETFAFLGLCIQTLIFYVSLTHFLSIFHVKRATRLRYRCDNIGVIVLIRKCLLVLSVQHEQDKLVASGEKYLIKKIFCGELEGAIYLLI